MTGRPIRIKVLESGAFQFIRQDGRVFDSVLKPMQLWEWRHLMESNLKSGVKIDADTASTLWRGERMDYGLAIASLMLKRTYVPRVSADMLIRLSSVHTRCSVFGCHGLTRFDWQRTWLHRAR